jgi:hypothetical protein
MVNYMPTIPMVRISLVEKALAAAGREFKLFRRKHDKLSPYDVGYRLAISGKPGVFLRVLGVQWRKDPVNPTWRQWVFLVRGEGPLVSGTKSGSDVIAGADAPPVCQ